MHFDLEMTRLARTIALSYQRAGDYLTADYWFRRHMRHQFILKYRPWFFEV